jgi:transcription elongation regulator 1
LISLLKTLLREKDINPLHPWDMSLPKFVNDPRYVLLPSIATRREAFDEYCKERARELKQSSLKKDKQTANPKDVFEQLLRDEVASTRSTWTDFRKMWKTDRRFYGWGRDDREREKKFRIYLKELGERKGVLFEFLDFCDVFSRKKESSAESRGRFFCSPERDEGNY